MSEATPREVLAHLVAGIGGKPREGQERMVDAVYEALTEESHLMVEAGTGTGKSFGYLVPAMVWSAATGKRATISTATLPLQRQIITQDAPAVADAIRETMGSHVEVALLKGWNNYACLRKADGGFPEEDALLSRAEGEVGATATGEEVVRAREWALATDTGDRDDLVPGVSDRAWNQISIQKRECIGEHCSLRHECFPRMARAQAEEADIVVTNHALLGIQAAGTPVLPESDAYIVDEAHDLVDRVTGQLTRSLTGYELRSIARMLRQAGLDDEGLGDVADELADALGAVNEGRLIRIGDALSDTIARIMGKAQTAGGEVASLSSSNEEANATKNVLRSRLTELVNLCADLISGAVSEGRLVAWVSEYNDNRALYLAPLDVSGAIASGLFEDTPVVLTSATLQLGGSFDAMAGRVGFTFPSQGEWSGLDVGTPFDERRQGILYVAEHLSAPGREGYGDEHLQEIVDLIEASRGGALCLFTSRAGATRAAEYVRERIDLPVACQGDDQLPTLLEQFAADPSASLFGTLSLWQGVDVPGPTCRLVVIDRIPFPRPDDPLIQARTQAAGESGRNPFMTVSATHAALLLAQGAGRLLRRIDDRGVVAVLDSRLRKARYSGFLLASLPDMWRTTDRAVVLTALERLATGLEER
ncbi:MULTISPECIES: ATP-dependent DNA helicase [Trueperella]|uniref:Putative ATP-dependent helicase DinG n=1 Tax=Trueperella bernardiae TaxID=59561 RepID=A0A0W1KMA0_9ACTO|nr:MULTISPECIES: ATP-dependent DNA helicase [Trueperella]KTF04799.1 putative ATP-dependent helicase DinG [Trueperella bernardiae]MCM3907287.1 ATP-dependent DNA helicase [Trueperella bernardiae]OCW61100.1 ATP-dependent helicase [Trueperella bernardiae]OFS65798.1 ATP-dependent helicase [Trueperella sp. HMSC08H06]OFS75770.1 ATP-dependent helicase [Trueperella sp. HMSC08B05]